MHGAKGGETDAKAPGRGAARPAMAGGGMKGMDEEARRLWDAFAPRYDGAMDTVERLLFKGGREWVCARAGGAVVEVAIGTGRNLALYPPVARLVGVEQSPAMLAVARRRAAALGVAADLRQGDAQALDLPDASADTVVFTLALCSIPDHRRALSEAARVLRAGGRLVLMEHVRSPIAPVRWAERLLDPLAVRFQADHLLRDPVDDLPALGFEIEELRRSKLGLVELVSARRA